MRLALHDDAQAEALQQAEWYAKRDPAVAARLEGLIIELVERIARDPQEFPLMEVRNNPGDIRRARVLGFPLLIIYQILADEVLVVAFAHTSRRPGYWRSRLSRPAAGDS